MKKTEYSEEFKQSVVNLYRYGKPSSEILHEYGISSSAFYKWVKKYSVVKISETESMTMVEIKAMQKRLALLEEENLILKKNNIHLHKGLKEKCLIIQGLRNQHEISLLCRIFKVPRSSYYQPETVETGTGKPGDIHPLIRTVP